MKFDTLIDLVVSVKIMLGYYIYFQSKMCNLVLRPRSTKFSLFHYVKHPIPTQYYCGRPWPAAYINIIQNTHQTQVLTEALCRAQAIFYSLPNNEWGTKYRGLTYSAK